MPDRLLTIGEPARRAGVATSALRYYDEHGTLAAVKRHGQSAVIGALTRRERAQVISAF